MGKWGKKAQAGKSKKLTQTNDIGGQLDATSRSSSDDTKTLGDAVCLVVEGLAEDCAICLPSLSRCISEACYQACCENNICQARDDEAAPFKPRLRDVAQWFSDRSLPYTQRLEGDLQSQYGVTSLEEIKLITLSEWNSLLREDTSTDDTYPTVKWRVFLSEFTSFATEKFDATKSKPMPIEDAREETEACWCLPVVPVRRKQDEREEGRIESSYRQLANEGLVLTTT